MSNIENVNTLKEDNSNEVSRRRVVQGAGALGLSAAFAGSAITMPLATAQSEEVKMGGELNFSVSSAPLYIDPAASGSATEYIILRACYNTLFRVNETLELELELVEDYEISDDGLVYTLKLRDGITFHHGKALTSEDVVYTFNRVMDEATASSGAPLFDTVASIEAPDDLTVVFTLASDSRHRVQPFRRSDAPTTAADDQLPSAIGNFPNFPSETRIPNTSLIILTARMEVVSATS